MKKVDIARAWTDEDYYLGLSAAERALLPENPAGVVELSDEQLKRIAGQDSETFPTACFTFTVANPCNVCAFKQCDD